MNQRLILTKFEDIRKDYTYYKNKINSCLLYNTFLLDEPEYRQYLTEIGDNLDNKFDEFDLILHGEI